MKEDKRAKKATEPNRKADLEQRRRHQKWVADLQASYDRRRGVPIGVAQNQEELILDLRTYAASYLLEAPSQVAQLRVTRLALEYYGITPKTKQFPLSFEGTHTAIWRDGNPSLEDLANKTGEDESGDTGTRTALSGAECGEADPAKLSGKGQKRGPKTAYENAQAEELPARTDRTAQSRSAASAAEAGNALQRDSYSIQGIAEGAMDKPDSPNPVERFLGARVPEFARFIQAVQNPERADSGQKAIYALFGTLYPIGGESIIAKLPEAAFLRMEAETAAFLADYLPRLEREANGGGPLHDAALVRELVIHRFSLVARECMVVCTSVEEFVAELRWNIARFVCYGLSQYGWVTDPMARELDAGFTFFVMGAKPWAAVREADRDSVLPYSGPYAEIAAVANRTGLQVGAITAEALSHLALKLRAEACKQAAEGAFSKTDQDGARGPSGDKSNPDEAGPAVSAGKSKGKGRKRGPKGTTVSTELEVQAKENATRHPPASFDWDTVEIRFLSDERLHIRTGTNAETRNYAEFGFEDGRSGKPNRAWTMLRLLAEHDGAVKHAGEEKAWSKVEKRVEEIRRVLRAHFGTSDDPLPFIAGKGYRARFKISSSRSYDS